MNYLYLDDEHKNNFYYLLARTLKLTTSMSVSNMKPASILLQYQRCSIAII